MKRLTDVLQNQGENYILPFFWQHGETEAKLREYMNAIHDCGIGAVCCECRPHPDFCGPQWWHDLDVILDEAKKLDMKVWILDDAHFPTGQANGAMVEAPAELCKQFLHYHEAEISGPTPGITLDVASMARYRKNPMSGGGRMGLFSAGAPAREFDDDELVAVVAADGLENGIDGRTLIDITDHVHDGVLTWDVPAGYWRVFVVYKTRNGGGNAHYINAVSFPSCRVQLDAVYEPHWAHYKDEFGKTIVGFFSDEPQLGNVSGFDPDNWIGKKMPLPWSDEVESELKTRLGDRYTALLATLWFPDKSGPDAAFARYHYMDVITRAVERDFSFQIGDWCAAHGVKYIGHTIEDNNEHARMGQSFAHQFRGLGGQHMGGIDDIGGQVLFGADHLMRSGGLMPTAGEPISDGEFFHYMLGKLGASHGHLDPRKRGDSMCEIFGAYGWSEGTRLMKYLADHFMVRGVNHFVPHAFSPREFPDDDCPPHFYAHGLNPLYKGFGQLMRYMNRVCHLISGGTAKPAVAVLYHAEGEWTSREEGYLLTQKPLRVLAQAQIDADILWTDVLVERERYQTTLGRTLTVAGTSFRALVIPYSYYITSHLAAFLTEAQAAGFPVCFVGGRPQAIADVPELPLPAAVAAVPVLSLDALAAAMAPYADVRLDVPFPGLRCLHYGHESDLYFFTNESPELDLLRPRLPDRRGRARALRPHGQPAPSRRLGRRGRHPDAGALPVRGRGLRPQRRGRSPGPARGQRPDPDRPVAGQLQRGSRPVRRIPEPHHRRRPDRYGQIRAEVLRLGPLRDALHRARRGAGRPALRQRLRDRRAHRQRPQRRDCHLPALSVRPLRPADRGREHAGRRGRHHAGARRGQPARRPQQSPGRPDVSHGRR